MVFVGGWYSTELLLRSAREEFEAAKAHIAMTKAAGAEILIAAETSNAIHGDARDAAVRAPAIGGERLGRLRRQHDGVRRVASPMWD